MSITADGISSSRVSSGMLMKALEDELGDRLFVRSTKGLTLTPKGELLERRAEEMLELLEETKAEVAAFGGELAGETEGMGGIVRAFAALQSRHPKVRLHVVSGSEDEAARRILTGLADFGIVFDPFDLTAFDHLRLARNELWGVVVRRGSPLAALPAVTAEALLARHLILSRQMLGKNGLAGWWGGSASARPTRSSTPRSSWSRKAWATSSSSRASSPRPNREISSSGRSKPACTSSGRRAPSSRRSRRR